MDGSGTTIGHFIHPDVLRWLFFNTQTSWPGWLKNSGVAVVGGGVQFSYNSTERSALLYITV